MAEDEQPSFAHGFREDVAFVRQGVFRLAVAGGDAAELEVVRGRDEVAEVGHALATVGDDDDLVAQARAAGATDLDPGSDDTFPIQKLQPVRNWYFWTGFSERSRRRIAGQCLRMIWTAP
jgi:hypothetical protein